MIRNLEVCSQDEERGTLADRIVTHSLNFNDVGQLTGMTFADTGVAITNVSSMVLVSPFTMGINNTSFRISSVASEDNVYVAATATNKLSFYGVPPISQAVLATGTGKTVDNVITALQNLGLVKQS